MGLITTDYEIFISDNNDVELKKSMMGTFKFFGIVFLTAGLYMLPVKVFVILGKFNEAFIESKIVQVIDLAINTCSFQKLSFTQGHIQK